MSRLFSTLFLLVSGTVQAATSYYVDNVATGNNDGSSWTNAWTSLEWIWESNVVLSAGDTLYISGGTTGKTYTTGLVPYNWNGTEANPIVIRTGVDAGHTGHVTISNAIVIKYNCSWVTVNGTKSDSFSDTNLTALEVERIKDNINLTLAGPGKNDVDQEFGINSGPGKGIRILWTECRGWGGALSTESGGGAIYMSSGSGQDPIPLYHAEIAFCWIHDLCGPGICIGNAPQITAYGELKIHHCLFELIGNNIINNVNGTCIDWYNCWSRWTKTPCNAGVHPDPWQETTLYCRIYNNVFEDLEASGLIYAGVYSCDGFRLYNNLCFFATNLTSLDQGGFPTIGEKSLHSDVYVMTNVLVANNTVLSGAYGTYMPSYGSWIDNLIISNVHFLNNIYQSVADLDYEVVAFGPSTNNFINFDYNSVGGFYRRISYDNTNYADADAFNAAWPAMGHNTKDVPNFVDTNASNFRISATDTAARNKGLDLSAWITTCPDIDKDIIGVARGQQGAWDIGAFEFNPNSHLKLHLDFSSATNSRWLTNANGPWAVGGTVFDESGNMNHGIRMSATNWPYRTNSYPNYAAGFRGPYADYPGDPAYHQGDYISITNLTGIEYLTNATISIRAWFRSSGGVEATLVDCFYADGPTTNSWMLGRHEDSRVTFNYATGAGTYEYGLYFPDDTVGGGDTATTNWAMYTVVFTPTNMYAYYNGLPVYTNAPLISFLHVPYSTFGGVGANKPWIAVGCKTHSGTPEWTGTGDSYPNSGWFDGMLRDVRIYDTNLTSGEILSLYNGSSPGTTSGEDEEEPPATPTTKMTIGTANIGTLFIR